MNMTLAYYKAKSKVRLQNEKYKAVYNKAKGRFPTENVLNEE